MLEKTSMYAHVLDNKIQKSLEKLQNLQRYNEARDSNEHVEHVNDRLDYYHADRAMKWNLFPLILAELVVAWYKSLMHYYRIDIL